MVEENKNGDPVGGIKRLTISRVGPIAHYMNEKKKWGFAIDLSEIALIEWVEGLWHVTGKTGKVLASISSHEIGKELFDLWLTWWFDPDGLLGDWRHNGG